jgi:hypothetical protein
MTWSFPGVSYPVELIYTQNRGVSPDALLMKFLPQLGNIPTSGTATLTYSTSVTLPNCVLDSDTLQMHPDGIHHTIIGWDRRYRWQYAPPITGWYNTARAGTRVSARERTLRQLVVLLLTQLGEGSANVSAVPTTVYPEVRWEAESPAAMLDELMKEHGLDLCLGFGAEAVTIVQVGTGTTLPTSNIFMQSLTADPKLRPLYIRTCFGPSRMQARFKLEAVGLDTDGTWQLIDDLAYIPAGTGWALEDPYTMLSVLAASGEDDHKKALATVFRAYRIVTFTDDTLNLPDSSGTLGSINDVLPLLGQLLVSEDLRSDGSYKPYRLFGKHWREVKERGQPDVFETTDVDFEISHYRLHVDLQNGVVFFEDPIFQVVAEEFVPADLYLEVSFEAKHPTNFAPVHKEIDTAFDPLGYGYYMVKRPNLYHAIVTSYDATQTATGTTNNLAALTAVATAEAAIVAASMPDTFGQLVTYSIPKLAIRLDGAISQIRHVLTNGENRDPVNRTTAARFLEFDKKITSRAVRFSHAQGIMRGQENRWRTSMGRRRDASDL